MFNTHFLLINFFCSIFFMAINSGETLAKTSITYHISFSEPQAHYIDVQMDVSAQSKDYIDLKMPVWAPGSYLVREFAKNVEAFSAKTPNSILPFTKINKNTWRITKTRGADVQVNYRIYAFELSVRTSFVDASHAFLSPSGIFMYVDGQIDNPATVKIEPIKGWHKISTGLEPVRAKENTFFAPDFDTLYDCPIEVGNQDVFEFTAAGVKHEFAMYGGGNYDKAKLINDVSKIIEQETAIFGENPNKRYVFIVHHTMAGGGGLEHLNSTVLGAKRFGYSDETSYKSFLGLVAHEYFHLWNVKRLRPKALGPFNYDEENYTTDLWISEGFTAYYDNLILRRAGIYSPEKYFEILNTDINTVENQPGNSIQPVSEASFDAWIKYYRPTENSKNSTISYYDKGALLAMIIDLEILGATQGAKGLDDVMKDMYDEYYKKKKRGFTDAEFKATAERFAGKPLDDIYSRYVNGTEPIKYNNYLVHAGVYLHNENTGKLTPYLGISTAVKDGKLVITNVARKSSAWDDGLNVNDEIIAIDNFRITGAVDATTKNSDLERSVNSRKVGDSLEFLVSRDGVLQKLKLTLKANPSGKFKLELDKDATPEQLSVRKRWLAL